MPVIVVGADTELGGEVVVSLLDREGEVRAFVSDPAVGQHLRDLGVKVAVGDVSDGSHIAGAALNCFAAVLDPVAAADDRDRAFAESVDAVVAAWAEALADARIRRAIWLGAAVPEIIAVSVLESVAVRRDGEAPGRIRRLDELPGL